MEKCPIQQDGRAVRLLVQLQGTDYRGTNSMNKLIKALLFALPLALMGCADEYDTTVSTAGYPALGVVNNGCIVVNDEAFGEREICSQYYMSNGGYVWWDAAYSMWISPYGYYQGGV